MTEVKSKADIIVDKCLTISKWAFSCKTLEQLTTVENNLEKLSTSCYGTSNARITYNLGIAQGYIFCIKKQLTNENE